MPACAGYTCLSRSLEWEDALEAQEARAGQEQPEHGGGLAIAVPVLEAVGAPAAALFGGTPLDIIRAALDPWRRRSAT